MLEITIFYENYIPVVLDEETELTMELNSPLFAFGENKELSYSYNFSVPNNAENRNIVNILRVLSNRGNAHVYFNAILIFTGIISFKRQNKNSIEFYLLVEEGGFFEKNRETKIFEISKEYKFHGTQFQVHNIISDYTNNSDIFPDTDFKFVPYAIQKSETNYNNYIYVNPFGISFFKFFEDAFDTIDTPPGEFEKRYWFENRGCYEQVGMELASNPAYEISGCWFLLSILKEIFVFNKIEVLENDLETDEAIRRILILCSEFDKYSGAESSLKIDFRKLPDISINDFLKCIEILFGATIFISKNKVRIKFLKNVLFTNKTIEIQKIRNEERSFEKEKINIKAIQVDSFEDDVVARQNAKSIHAEYLNYVGSWGTLNAIPDSLLVHNNLVYTTNENKYYRFLKINSEKKYDPTVAGNWYFHAIPFAQFPSEPTHLGEIDGEILKIPVEPVFKYWLKIKIHNLLSWYTIFSEVNHNVFPYNSPESFYFRERSIPYFNVDLESDESLEDIIYPQKIKFKNLHLVCFTGIGTEINPVVSDVPDLYQIQTEVPEISGNYIPSFRTSNVPNYEPLSVSHFENYGKEWRFFLAKGYKVETRQLKINITQFSVFDFSKKLNIDGEIYFVKNLRITFRKNSYSHCEATLVRIEY